MTLVLDLIHSTLGDPVNGSSQIRIVKLFSLNDGLLCWLVSEQILVFFSSPVRELIEANSRSVTILAVDDGHLFLGCKEHGKSESIFLFSSIRFAPLCCVRGIFRVIITKWIDKEE